MNIPILNAAPSANIGQIMDKLVDIGLDAGKNIVIALLIYLVGRFIIRQINKMVRKLLEKGRLEYNVQTFLRNLINVLLNMVLIFAIIGKLGIETTSLAALLASAGVAVGMALSGNLSNFAGGLIILVFKPFKAGDYIEGPNFSGTVKEVQIFHTILSTLDNRIIYVPNSILNSNAVTNYSKQELRRVDWVFGVKYGEDVQYVRDILAGILERDERIRKDPPSQIVLGKLNTSTVDMIVRAWVLNSDYWDVLYDINEKVYSVFGEKGISFPFPQITIHRAADR